MFDGINGVNTVSTVEAEGKFSVDIVVLTQIICIQIN